MSETSYSVVIRVKNGERTIKTCIDSLISQTVPPKEIIVVDSGSNDRTIEIVSEYSICKVIQYPKEKFNYSKALNLGINAASQPIILNFSSHCMFVDQNSTQIMLDFITKNEMAAAVTFGHSRKKEWKHPKSPSTISYRKINQSNFKGHAMDNPCAMIRKYHWQLRNFNESLERCEDQEWAYHWIKNENYFCVMIDQPRLIYDQPDFDAKKVAKDFYTVGRLLHSYPSSVFFMLKLFGAGLIKPKRLKDYFRVIFFLITFKIFPEKAL